MKPILLALLAGAMAAGVICVLGLILLMLAEPVVECGWLAPGVDPGIGHLG
jgi:hypothetical protein